MKRPPKLEQITKLDIISLFYSYDMTPQDIASRLSVSLEKVEGYIEYLEEYMKVIEGEQYEI